MSNKDVRTPPKGRHENPENVAATAAMMLLRSAVMNLEQAIGLLAPFQQQVMRVNGQKNILALENEVVRNAHTVIIGQLEDFGLMELFAPGQSQPPAEEDRGPKVVSD